MADVPDMHTTSQLPLLLGERGQGAMKKTTRTGGLGVDSRETILEQDGPFPGAETRTDAVSDSETDAPATPPLNELVQQELLDLAEHEGNLRSRLSAAAQLLGQCQASPQTPRAAQPMTCEQACGDDTAGGSLREPAAVGRGDQGALTAAISSFVDSCLESLGTRVLQTSERHEARIARLAECVERVSAARIWWQGDDCAAGQEQVIRVAAWLYECGVLIHP